MTDLSRLHFLEPPKARYNAFGDSKPAVEIDATFVDGELGLGEGVIGGVIRPGASRAAVLEMHSIISPLNLNNRVFTDNTRSLNCQVVFNAGTTTITFLR